MKKRMKFKSSFISILILVVLLTVILTIGIYQYIVIDYKEVKTGIIVNADLRAGFGIMKGNDFLYFGSMYRGGMVEQKVDLKSDYRAWVKIKIEGNISDFVSVSENNFILEPYQQKEITFTASIPETAIPGNYTGDIRFYFLKPIFS